MLYTLKILSWKIWMYSTELWNILCSKTLTMLAIVELTPSTLCHGSLRHYWIETSWRTACSLLHCHKLARLLVVYLAMILGVLLHCHNVTRFARNVTKNHECVCVCVCYNLRNIIILHCLSSSSSANILSKNTIVSQRVPPMDAAPCMLTTVGTLLLQSSIEEFPPLSYPPLSHNHGLLKLGAILRDDHLCCILFMVLTS